MGPCAKREYQSHLLELGDWPKNKRNGASDASRTAARDAVGKLKEEERINDTKNERGLPKKEQILIFQAEAGMDQRRHESNILALAQVIDSLHKRVEVYSKLIAGMSGAAQKNFMTQIEKLMMEIAEKETSMMDLTTKKRRLILEESPPVTSIVTTTRDRNSVPSTSTVSS